MKWDLPGRVPRMTLHFVLCMWSWITSKHSTFFLVYAGHILPLSKGAWWLGTPPQALYKLTCELLHILMEGAQTG